jgi:hypothetical protein
MTSRIAISLTVTAAALPIAPALGSGAASAAETAGQQPTANASVVRVERRVPPRAKVIHRKFKPWAKPSPRQTRMIIRSEARRWRISPARLARRVACESRFRWYASNGQYQGLLQFAHSTFARGMRTIRDRRVRLVYQRVRTIHVARTEYYSDGTKKRTRGKARRQRVTVIYTGRLPRHPAHGHGWSQLRIGAQAIRGISAVHSSEWACAA